MSRSNKEKYDPPNPRRSHSIMSTEDVASGKRSYWPELEITGPICNLSPQLWKLNHLTSLYLNDNNLTMIPPDIARLSSLMYLDLSSNQLHSLPSELGDLIMLRELLVNNNHLRMLPMELGKLFQLQHLGLSGNPLAMCLLNIYREPNGTLKLLSYMLDNLSGCSSPPPKTSTMSPQPEAVLDVQKYIGTCLISQKPRNRKSSRAKGKAAGSGSSHPRKAFPMNPPPSVHAHGFSRCECCGQFRYGPASPSSLVNLQWTGYPLYNLACYKKSNGAAQASKSIRIPAPRGVQRDPCQSEGELSPDSVSPPVLEDHARLSKLAIHAHGAPLILTCKTVYHSKNGLAGGGRNRNVNRSFIREFQEGLALSEHCPASQFTRNGTTQNCFGYHDLERYDAKGSPPTGEGNGLALEESTVLADGQYLRVLKPRKRRKRDRRVPHFEEGESAPACGGPKTLVTLEPYRPLCYRFDGGVDYGKGYLSAAAVGSELKDFEKEPSNAVVGNGSPKCPYASSSLCCCSACCPSPSPPPRSPGSCSSSSLSPCSSCSSSESCSSLPSESVSPFPTPPPSPLALSGSKEPEAEPEMVSSIVISSATSSSVVNGSGWEAKRFPSGSRERDRPNLTSSTLSHLEPKQSRVTFRPVVAFTSTQPPARPWVSMHNPTRNQPACTFTVMCYNVLCDKYATRQMYGYCPNWALNWEYRRKGIMDEIRHYMADIISLQEVETEQFYNMFLPELKKDGYEGIFSPKSRAKTMNENDRKYVDGCAIFFRASKFRLIKEHLVEFTQLAMANAEGSDDMLNRVMTKDNIGLAAVLETREGAWENSQVPVDPSHVHQPLLVCTAHIHWDPEYCDVKLIQTMMLMHELRGIIEESSRSFRPRSHKPNCNAIPLLLCGDFNSLPDSGVIEFLTSGRISSSHPDLKELGYKACLQKLSTSEKSNEYTHSFKIARAYSDENMPFTNYTFDFKGIIDYILHSETLKPTGLLGPLDLDWLRIHKVVGCPHPHVPSDHLPLLVEYEMLAQQPPLTNGLVVQR